jgi:hypothetical protein
MNFRLVDIGWRKALLDASKESQGDMRLICPFIKERTVRRLLRSTTPSQIQVITRFNLMDYYSGVSDLSALEFLLSRGAEIRGVKNLHAKVYLFGSEHAFVTSANLTECALGRNHEFGFETKDSEICDYCLQYFDGLWKRAGSNVSPLKLKEWNSRVVAQQAHAKPFVSNLGLEDNGVDAGLPAEPKSLPASVSEADQAFIKFFGEGDNRSPLSQTIHEVVRSAGCHWACTYPRGKRPRQVNDGAVMFMARLVENPLDTIIFGRGIALEHVEGRDDATSADIERRGWKERWPHYIRVHHTEFINGSLGEGISLAELMDELKSNAFASTQRNKAAGEGNTDPRHAFRQQAAVELSPEGFHWLRERLENAFAKNGTLSQSFLSKLDWPNKKALGLVKR